MAFSPESGTFSEADASKNQSPENQEKDVHTHVDDLRYEAKKFTDHAKDQRDASVDHAEELKQKDTKDVKQEYTRPKLNATDIAARIKTEGERFLFESNCLPDPSNDKGYFFPIRGLTFNLNPRFQFVDNRWAVRWKSSQEWMNPATAYPPTGRGEEQIKIILAHLGELNAKTSDTPPSTPAASPKPTPPPVVEVADTLSDTQKEEVLQQMQKQSEGTALHIQEYKEEPSPVRLQDLRNAVEKELRGLAVARYLMQKEPTDVQKRFESILQLRVKQLEQVQKQIDEGTKHMAPKLDEKLGEAELMVDLVIQREQTRIVNAYRLRHETGLMGAVNRGVTLSDPYALEIIDAEAKVSSMEKAKGQLTEASADTDPLSRAANVQRALNKIATANKVETKFWQQVHALEQSAITVTRDTSIAVLTTVATMGTSSIFSAGAQAGKEVVKLTLLQSMRQGMIMSGVTSAEIATAKGIDDVTSGHKTVAQAVDDGASETALGVALGGLIPAAGDRLKAGFTWAKNALRGKPAPSINGAPNVGGKTLTTIEELESAVTSGSVTIKDALQDNPEQVRSLFSGLLNAKSARILEQSKVRGIDTSLPLEEQVAKILGSPKPLTTEQMQSVLEAHLVGATKGKTIGTYDVADIGEKARTLKGDAKNVETFTKDQRRILMEDLQLAGIEQKNLAMFVPKDGERVRLTQGIKSQAGADIPPGEYTYKVIGGRAALAPVDGTQPYGVNIATTAKFLQPNVVSTAAPAAAPKTVVQAPKPIQQPPAAPANKPAPAPTSAPVQEVIQEAKMIRVGSIVRDGKKYPVYQTPDGKFHHEQPGTKMFARSDAPPADMQPLKAPSQPSATPKQAPEPVPKASVQAPEKTKIKVDADVKENLKFAVGISKSPDGLKNFPGECAEALQYLRGRQDGVSMTGKLATPNADGTFSNGVSTFKNISDMKQGNGGILYRDFASQRGAVPQSTGIVDSLKREGSSAFNNRAAGTSVESVHMLRNGNKTEIAYQYLENAHAVEQRGGVALQISVSLEPAKAEAVYAALQAHPEHARNFFMAASREIPESATIPNLYFKNTGPSKAIVFGDYNAIAENGGSFKASVQVNGRWQQTPVDKVPGVNADSLKQFEGTIRNDFAPVSSYTPPEPEKGFWGKMFGQ